MKTLFVNWIICLTVRPCTNILAVLTYLQFKSYLPRQSTFYLFIFVFLWTSGNGMPIWITRFSRRIVFIVVRINNSWASSYYVWHSMVWKVKQSKDHFWENLPMTRTLCNITDCRSIPSCMNQRFCKRIFLAYIVKWLCHHDVNTRTPRPSLRSCLQTYFYEISYSHSLNWPSYKLFCTELIFKH